MSDPRSTYPKATAWTFLLDTPAAEAASGTKKAPPPATAGGGGPRRAAAAGAAKAAAKRKPSLTGSSCSANEEMGAACSKSNDAVTNKENMGRELEEMLVPNGDSHDDDDALCKSNLGAGSEPLQAPKEEEGAANERAVLGGAALDSTAFLSPEPEEQEQGVDEAEDLVVVAVENGIVARLRGGGGHAGAAGGDGSSMGHEDRSAWIARKLEVLPTRSAAVEVDQLKQVRETWKNTEQFAYV